MIHYFSEAVEHPTLPKNISLWISSIAHSEDKSIGELNIIFCDDEYLLGINRTHLQHDYYTDIITFDYCKGKKLSGDIFISLQRVADNAKLHNTTTQNELLRVIAHGILHLAGYGDKSPEENTKMRNLEDKYLATALTII